MSVTIKVCSRCGHEWATRQERPLRCAKCKSAYWDQPRVRQKVDKGKDQKESLFSRLFHFGG